MRKIIENVRFLQEGTMVFGDIHLEDGLVERIDYKSFKMDADYALSGFIDLHSHGFCGYQCDSTDIEELHKLALAYAQRGVVGFCATISTRSLQDYETIIKVYEQAFLGEYQGARFLGIHMEGPYLNKQMVNEKDQVKLQTINLSDLENFLKKYHHLVTIMTIAPELENALDAIKILHRYGIIISLGYSRAPYETAQQAIQEGATHITHLCNHMETIDYRHPGLIDAALTSNVMCELDMDGVHVHEIMLHWLVKLLGINRIMAITNGGKFCGFEYPDNFVLEDGGVVCNRVVYREGIESESTKDLLETFQYLFHSNQYDFHECVQMTSTNALLQLHNATHEIGLGKKVNLIVIDHNLELKDVFINGKSYL